MWFKNLRVYRLPQHWQMTPDEIRAALQTKRFTPLGNLDVLTHGWVPTRDDDLVYIVDRQMLLTLCTEKKLLPSAVIKTALQERIAEIEERQGYRPGRKQTKEIKEELIDEMLPKAFTTITHTRIWIDPVHGWLVVDAGSPGKAEVAVSTLIRSFEKLPLETLYLANPPLNTMTEWLDSETEPHDFTIDQDAELRASGESKATVRYTRHSLDHEDVRTHIASGKQCTRLGLTWRDRVSFVLHSDFAIKRIAPLDILTESESREEHEAERFASDFALMTGEINGLLSALLAAFGGEKPRAEAVEEFF